MVKIINKFGDVKQGKQHTVVYQGHYGNQMRRMLKDKKDEHTRGQLEQRDRFRTGINFAKNLTKAQRDFIKSYMAEAGIRSPDGLPTTWYTFAKKIAMTRPKIEIETSVGSGFSGTYANWSYRKPITLNNQTGGTLTNHPVLITLTGTNFDYSHCKNDGSDIRFSGSDGTTAQIYWIEDWNYNGTSKVWAKVDSIPSEGGTIYLYFGNNTASSESNFNDTFILGELWDNATIDSEKWPTITGNPVYSINTSEHYLEITNMDDGWQTGLGFYSKSLTFPDNYIIEKARDGGNYKMYVNSTTIQLGDVIFGNHHTTYSASDYGIAFTELMDDGNNRTHNIIAGVGGNSDYNSGQNQGQEAYRNFLIWKLSGNIKIKYEESTVVDEANSEVPDRIFIGISKLANYVFGTFRMYEFKVRPYADPEPTTQVGEEEASTKNLLKSFKIRHPAIKSYKILDNGPKEENLSDLENHISSVVTRTNLDVGANKIIVKTLANQEYEFIVK